MKQRTAEILNKDFSFYVRNIRQHLGLSERELSYKLGVNRSSILDWEQGKNMPPNKKEIAHLLKNLIRDKNKNKRS